METKSLFRVEFVLTSSLCWSEIMCLNVLAVLCVVKTDSSLLFSCSVHWPNHVKIDSKLLFYLPWLSLVLKTHSYLCCFLLVVSFSLNQHYCFCFIFFRACCVIQLWKQSLRWVEVQYFYLWQCSYAMLFNTFSFSSSMPWPSLCFWNWIHTYAVSV